MLRWLSFIFSIALLCSQPVENVNPFDVFTCVYIDLWLLIFVSCFCYSLEDIFLSWRVYCILLSVVCEHKIKIFMFAGDLLVCTIVFETAVQFVSNCFWLLIYFCRKVALSCLIDTGVIVKPWDWSAMVLCMPMIKRISGPCSSSHNLHLISG